MRVEIYGCVPRLPRVEVYLEGESRNAARSIIGGRQIMPLMGDLAVRLSAAEFDALPADLPRVDMREQEMNNRQSSLA